ncbi:hypothetical protein FT641_20160 [Bacillus paranthracis]|uniref:hypothetical protein n=1 Tax=Bacillus paranthracis TaxID=2026186 RepID=UPI001879B77B|nr:hypothetical protein [Bacillus paranthracis]MBE7114623.1 hypothetical protein [Bacillus paranthracis]MBE7155010.1 hypothetical protein [Bacillus paranthracis]
MVTRFKDMLGEWLGCKLETRGLLVTNFYADDIPEKYLMGADVDIFVKVKAVSVSQISDRLFAVTYALVDYENHEVTMNILWSGEGDYPVGTCVRMKMEGEVRDINREDGKLRLSIGGKGFWVNRDKAVVIGINGYKFYQKAYLDTEEGKKDYQRKYDRYTPKVDITRSFLN